MGLASSFFTSAQIIQCQAPFICISLNEITKARGRPVTEKSHCVGNFLSIQAYILLHEITERISICTSDYYVSYNSQTKGSLSMPSSQCSTWVPGMPLLICMTLALRADNFHSPFPVFPASFSLITDHHTSMVAKLRNVLEQMQSLTKGRNGAL